MSESLHEKITRIMHEQNVRYGQAFRVATAEVNLERLKGQR